MSGGSGLALLAGAAAREGLLGVCWNTALLKKKRKGRRRSEQWAQGRLPVSSEPQGLPGCARGSVVFLGKVRNDRQPSIFVKILVPMSL